MDCHRFTFRITRKLPSLAFTFMIINSVVIIAPLCVCVCRMSIRISLLVWRNLHEVTEILQINETTAGVTCARRQLPTVIPKSFYS
jgi:hypothetical protein